MQVDPEDLRRAADPATPGAVLRSLAAEHDPALLPRVAANPSCPLDLLLRLAAWCPAEVASNEALKLHLLSHGAAVLVDSSAELGDDPELRWGVETLLLCPEAAWLLPAATLAPEPWMRVRVACNRAASAETLLALISSIHAPEDLGDERELALGALVRHPALSPEAMRELVRRLSDWEERELLAALASRRDVLPDVLEELGRSQVHIIQHAVASNPSTPVTTLRALLQSSGDQALRLLVLRNPSLPREDILALLDASPADRLLAAHSDRLPADQLAALAGDPMPAIRMACAGNPALAPELLARLALDEEIGVREQVARRPDTPAEVLAALERDPEAFVRDCLASNPALAPELLRRLSFDDDDAVRTSAASNPRLPRQELARLAGDVSSLVRSAVAAAPELPEEAMQALARDEEVRLSLMANPALPASCAAALFEVYQEWGTPERLLFAASLEVALWAVHELKFHPESNLTLDEMTDFAGMKPELMELLAREAGAAGADREPAWLPAGDARVAGLGPLSRGARLGLEDPLPGRAGRVICRSRRGSCRNSRRGRRRRRRT